MKSYVDNLPKFRLGTTSSFFDKLSTTIAPQGFTENASTNSTVIEGDTYNLNISLDVVGSSITRSQADSIIQPLIESAERLSKKKGGNFNLA